MFVSALECSTLRNQKTQTEKEKRKHEKNNRFCRGGNGKKRDA